MNIRRLLLCCCCVVPLLSQGAPDELSLIPLKHRTTDDIIPLLRPLLGPDEALSGNGFQLILRAGPASTAQVRALLEQLDRAPRNLLITVRHNDSTSAERQRLEAAGSVRLGDQVELQAGQTSRDGATVRIEKSHNTRRNNSEQQLRVLEGQRALIQTGQSIPQRERQVIMTPGATVLNENVRYRDVVSGFYVVPRLQGEIVTLEIQPGDASVQGGNRTIESQQLHTVVSGRLGEWIMLGGIDQDARTRDQRILSTRRQQSYQNFAYSVKVELAP